MTVMLATLVLNEMEHLPNLYAQHKDWPGLTQWVFVESADSVYAQTNPSLVTEEGLSVDGTTEYLHALSQSDSRVKHIKFGFCSHSDPAQGKIIARQQYMNVAEEVEPTYIVTLDADEFYSYSAQGCVLNLMEAYPKYRCYRLRQRDIWRPERIKHRPLFNLEVVGGYWNVRHCRFWRWAPGLQYTINHNWPSLDGVEAIKSMMKFDKVDNNPQCVHLGFASKSQFRAAKNHYYVARGEGAGDGRTMYVECRAAFERWRPGVPLPHRAKVIPYNGVIPECFTPTPGAKS